MPETDVNRLLSEIWSRFKTVGISNDRDIVEHIAALLTEGQRAPAEDVQPRMPPRRVGLDLDEVRRFLSEAIAVVGNAAILFDRTYCAVYASPDSDRGRSTLGRFCLRHWWIPGDT